MKQNSIRVKTEVEQQNSSRNKHNSRSPELGKYIHIKQKVSLPYLNLTSNNSFKSFNLVKQSQEHSSNKFQLNVQNQPSKTKNIKPIEVHEYIKLSSEWQNIRQESETIVRDQKHKADNYDPVFQSKILQQTIGNLIQSTELLDEIIKFKTIEELALDREWSHLEGVLSVLKNQEIKETYINILSLMIIKGKAQKENGDIYSAIQNFQRQKQLAQNSGNLYLKMRVYKILGNMYLQTNASKKALNCFLKMLNLSWFFKHVGYELYAYDKLSICFMYLGDLQTAIALHGRMSIGKKEPNTQIKQYALKRAVRMKGKVDLKNEYLTGIHNLSDTSEEDECYISEMARNDIKNVECLMNSVLNDEQNKQTKSGFSYLMHQSNNRRKLNFQPLSDFDLINKRIGQNVGFKYIWTKVFVNFFFKWQTKRSFKKYKQRLIKLRKNLSKQMNQQEVDPKLMKSQSVIKVRRFALK